jgi:uncharacterized protein (DUF433 family)
MSRRKANPAVLDQIISRDPETMSGAAVFAGMRVPVQTLFDHLAAGRSIEEFREGFPRVQHEQIIGLLRHVGELIEEGRV